MVSCDSATTTTTTIYLLVEVVRARPCRSNFQLPFKWTIGIQLESSISTFTFYSAYRAYPRKHTHAHTIHWLNFINLRGNALKLIQLFWSHLVSFSYIYILWEIYWPHFFPLLVQKLYSFGGDCGGVAADFLLWRKKVAVMKHTNIRINDPSKAGLFSWRQCLFNMPF